MAGYIGSPAVVVSNGAERKKTYSITGTTTSLTGLNYTVNQVHVFHNGVRLVDGTDFTATNGNSITLTNAAQAGDEVVVISYAGYQVSDTVSASGGGTFNDDIEINGDLTVDTNTLYVDSTNNRVGVGTVSPDQRLHLSGTGTQSIRIENTNTNLIVGSVVGQIEFEGNDLGASGVTAAVKAVADSVTGKAALVFDTGTAGSASEAMRIDSSGSVGIVTSSPADDAHISKSNSGGDVALRIQNSATTSGDTATLRFSVTSSSAFDSAFVGSDRNNALILGSNAAERMRIDSSGRVMIGTTSVTNTGVGGATFYPQSYDRDILALGSTTTLTGAELLWFYNPNGKVGRIETNANSTSYVTTSDYRLKTDAQPITGASARVQALNPVNFEWLSDGTRVDGFLAHEAQEIVPEAVTGTKDAMITEEYEVTPAVYEDVVIPAVLDDDGNEVEPERTEQRLVSEAVMGTREVPDYQGIDQSKMVPLLTAALQEALTEIADLKARVTALEAN